MSDVDGSISDVTLIHEIADPSSPASHFLAERLPNRSVVTDAWAANLSSRHNPPHPPDWRYRSRAGSAFEMRLGLDLAAEAPYRDVLTMIPPSEAVRVLTAAGLRTDVAVAEADAQLGGWRRTEQWDPSLAPDTVHRDAWHLSEFAELLHKVKHPNQSQWRRIYSTLQQEMWEGNLDAEAESMMHCLWDRYVHGGREALLGLGERCVVQPVFDDAFAVGDFVLGETLIDVKVYVDPVPALPTFLDQLVGYVLCDGADTFGIRSVGVYLGWQGVLLTASLDDVFETASLSASDLVAARQGFRVATLPAVQRCHFYKHGTVPL